MGDVADWMFDRAQEQDMTPMHRTRDGDVFPVSAMSDSHLLNTIRLHKRKAKEGVVVSYGGGTTAEDIWYDEDHLYGKEALDHLNHDSYVREAKRRGILNQKFQGGE